MSRQIDQEIIQSTDELRKDVALTTEIITGNEHTVVEVAPGNTVRSPKKMIEDCYQETQQAIEEKFESLDKAVRDAGAEADRAEVASQSSSDSAGDSATSASAAAGSATSASAHDEAAEQAHAKSEAAADESKTAANQSETHSITSGQHAAAALDSQNAAKVSETAAAKSASVSLTHSQDSAGSATDSEASAGTSAAEAVKAQQCVVDAIAQADRAEAEADRAEKAGVDSLKKTGNLSDLADKPISRTNLDVYSKGEIDHKIDSKDSLPEQAGQDKKFLQTDGTNASWQPAAISNPNLLINGDFSVWQRGTSFNFAPNISVYSADRWVAYSMKAVSVANHDVFTTKSAIAFTSHSTVGQYPLFDQVIENGVILIKNKKITCSLILGVNYAEELNNPKLHSMEIINQARNKVLAGVFDGTPDLKIESLQNGNWVKYSGTFYAGEFTTDDGDHCALRIAFKNDIPEFSAWISEVKLELGSVATPFIPDDPATSLAKCQRYYIKNIFNGTRMDQDGYNATWSLLNIDFPTTMRTVPTITLYGNGLAEKSIKFLCPSGIALRDNRSSLGGGVTGYEASAEL